MANDAARAAFDAWAAVHDPDGSMDDYERSRRYTKFLRDSDATRRAETACPARVPKHSQARASLEASPDPLQNINGDSTP